MLSALQGNIYLGSLGFLGGFLTNFGRTPQAALLKMLCGTVDKTWRGDSA